RAAPAPLPLLRAAQPEDLAQARQAGTARLQRLASCDHIVREQSPGSLALPDLEILLDASPALLCPGPPTPGAPFTQAIRRTCGLAPGARTVRPGPAAGLGCGSRGTSGGCGAAHHHGGCPGCAVKDLVAGRRRSPRP